MFCGTAFAAIGQTEGEKNPDWIWETIEGMV